MGGKVGGKFIYFSVVIIQHIVSAINFVPNALL